jgi:nucleoside 2-deoxyribosyltransferase
LISACDVVHAFISKEAGFTGGTKYEVEYAQSIGKTVFLYWEHSIVERVYQKSLPFSNQTKELSSGWMDFFLNTLG